MVGWSGMHGAVSLVAALALLLSSEAGQPFPRRNLIVFVTFGVLFATLVSRAHALRADPSPRVRGDGAEEREALIW